MIVPLPGRFEVAMSQLLCLSSLVLRIPAHDSHFPASWEYTETSAPDITCDIRFATKIFKQLKRGRLRDVRVVLEPDPVAALGCCLSSGNPSSVEACKALDEELLTFPSCGVDVFDAKEVRRSGRAEFWSPAINGAFSKLNEQGLFTFTHSKVSFRSRVAAGY